MDSPPGWDQIGHHLQRVFRQAVAEGERLRLPPDDGSWEALALWLFAREQAGRPALDQLCRGVARSSPVPATLSSEARLFLGYRCQAALDFLGMMHPPQAAWSPLGDVPAAASPAGVMEWLLIELWVRRHDHWLKLNAIGRRGPFSFYGIEPADWSKPS